MAFMDIVVKLATPKPAAMNLWVLRNGGIMVRFPENKIPLTSALQLLVLLKTEESPKDYSQASVLAVVAGNVSKVSQYSTLTSNNRWIIDYVATNHITRF